jgi:Family of unknown function (DUF6056)
MIVDKDRQRLEMVLGILFLMPLVLLAYLGLFSRYIADDYCSTVIALAKGILGSVPHWYVTYAGQYSNFVVKGMIAYADSGITALLPFLILVSWVAALTWTLFPIARQTGIRHAFMLSILFAMLIVVSIFSGVPSIVQSLYWFAASVPYTIPCILLTFYAGVFIRIVHNPSFNRVPLWAQVGTALFMLISGGFSEVFTAFQITLFVLIGLAYWKFAPPPIRHKALWLLAIALIFSILALAIIVLAPGRAIRQANFLQALSLSEIAVQTIVVTASYIIMGMGVFSPVPLIVIVSFSMLTAYQLQKSNPRLRLHSKSVRTGILLASGVGFIVIASTMAPPIYATSSAPPARGYIVAQTALVGLAAAWGMIMGFGVRRRSAQPGKPERLAQVLVLIVITGLIFITLKNAANIPSFNIYANEWDNRDQTIRKAVAQGINTLSVNKLSVDLGEREGLDIIDADPSGWVNQCAADYYGLEQLTAQPAISG